MIEEIARAVIKCGAVCRLHGVNRVCISSILPKKGYKSQLAIKHINDQISKMCKECNFDFIPNDNILFEEIRYKEYTLFYSNGVYLNDAGRQLLMKNFVHYLNID